MNERERQRERDRERQRDREMSRTAEKHLYFMTERDLELEGQ